MLFFGCYHCFGQHGLNEFVDVVLRLEEVSSFLSVVVNFPGEVTAWVLAPPIEAHIASPLVSQLQVALGFLLAHSSENQQSFLGLAQVSRVLLDVRTRNIDLARVVDF